MQPFDIACFRPFKNKMSDRLAELRLVEGIDSVTIYNFHKHMMPVYLACMKPSTIVNGFRKAGLCPFTHENIDWSKLEGKLRQDEAFHPDESVNVNGKWLAR